MAKKKLRTGELRWQISIEQVTRTQNSETGAWDETWATARTTRAKRSFFTAGSGEGIEDDLQLVGTQTIALELRKLDSAWNVSDYRVNDGGVIYDIVEIQKSGLGERFLKLVCVERNNDNS